MPDNLDKNAPGASDVLGLIPARGGSKHPPKKNIQPFRGRPLIVHTIEQGLNSKTIDRTIVSTDSEEIAQIARDAGADVPFLRPAEIAGDLATDFECFDHALAWLDENEGYRPEILVQLRCTAPLRPAAMIDRAVRMLQDHPEADSLRAVIPASHTPYKMWRLNGEYLEPLLVLPEVPEAYNEPRQKLPAIYWQNGYLDIIRRTTITEKRSMTGEKILALVMSPEDDIDIDSQRDLDRANQRSQ